MVHQNPIQLSAYLGLALICLAPRATLAGWFGEIDGRENKQADFDSLDQFLEDRLRADDSSGANLELMKAELRSLNGQTRRAAELLVKLSSVQKCNENVLMLLHEAAEAGLKYVGPRRTQKAIRPHLERVLKGCRIYLDQAIEERFNVSLASDKSLTKFLEVVGPPYFKFPGVARDVSEHLYESLMDNAYNIPTELQLNQFLKKLSQGDARAKFKEYKDEADESTTPIEHWDRFEYAFNRYLREPCRRFTSALAFLFEGAKVVANMGPSPYSYVKQRSPQFRCLAWTNEACRFILNMNQADRLVLLNKSW